MSLKTSRDSCLCVCEAGLKLFPSTKGLLCSVTVCLNPFCEYRLKPNPSGETFPFVLVGTSCYFSVLPHPAWITQISFCLVGAVHGCLPRETLSIFVLAASESLKHLSLQQMLSNSVKFSLVPILLESFLRSLESAYCLWKKPRLSLEVR